MIIDVQRASKFLPDGRPLLDEVSIQLAEGETLALLGRSGSGKSTLLSVLGLLDRFDTGTYALAGADVSSMSSRQSAHVRNTQIGFVFQRFSLLPHLTVLENVFVPMRHAGHRLTRAQRDRAADCLDMVGMLVAKRKRPHQLSGGEQQRVAIARALVKSPKLLLADEPTGSLDQVTGEQIFELLRSVVHAGETSMIIVTHDNELAHRTDSVLHLVSGSLQPVAGFTSFTGPQQE